MQYTKFKFSSSSIRVQHLYYIHMCEHTGHKLLLIGVSAHKEETQHSDVEAHSVHVHNRPRTCLGFGLKDSMIYISHADHVLPLFTCVIQFL